MKKALSIVLSLVILISITVSINFLAYANKSEDFQYRLSGGNAAITRYTGSAENLIVPSTINGYPVTSIDDYAFRFNTSLIDVTIPNGVTSIGEYAFHSCTNLVSLTMANSVINIGKCAFYDCSSLTDITISNSVGSIGESLFENCMSLKSITIPNGVTDIGMLAFRNCTSLISITIPNTVTSIGDFAFEYVNNIVYNGTATGSPWGAKSVNGYVDGYLVYKDSTKNELLGCSSQATNVTIPNTVLTIGNYAFSFCSSLTNIILPDSVISIGEEAFYDCISLTSVTIPNSVTIIGSLAFCNCTSLTNVTIPDSVTYIGSYAFESCTGLTSITIGNNVTDIGDYAFYGCISLKKVYIPNGVEYVHMGAFQNCPSLESITFPESVISAILPFDDCCVNLKEIVVLNKEMSVDLRDYSTIPSTLTIYGFRNSQAETDAEFYGVKFVALDKPILQDGTNTQYVIGSNVGAIIHCAYPLNEFVSVEINGSIVDSNNYTLAGGSTILTFKPSYLDTFGVGNYTVKLNYNNATANASLVIKNSTTENEFTEAEQEKNTNKNVENKVNDKKSPLTGAPNSSACLSLVILGIVALIIVFKKEKYKKSLN